MKKTFMKSSEFMDKLLLAAETYRHSIFEMTSSGIKKSYKWISIYQTDNFKDIDAPDYEEFWEIAFEEPDTKTVLLVNYHNLPDEVWCDGKLVYKREILRRKGGKNPNTNFPANE